MKTARDPALTERLVRPGSKVMKLDAEKGKPAKFPWLPGAKKKRDRVNTLEHMRRVGRMSMIQIGDDEFRTPSRRERREAGIRHRSRKVHAHFAQQRGIARLKTPLTVAPRPPVAPRTYTRKQKLLRKAIVERNAITVALTEWANLAMCIYRARGNVGYVPVPVMDGV
jgi:hypothetical protein